MTTNKILYADTGAFYNGRRLLTDLERTPAGSVSAFAGSSAPLGWLMCDGSAVSRTTYADLFAAIGGAFGVGDGSTTFNLPDMRGRMIVGVDSADPSFSTLNAAAGAKTVNVPAHAHGVSITTSWVGDHQHTYHGWTGFNPQEENKDNGGDDVAHAEHNHEYSGTTSANGGHNHSVNGGTAADGAASLNLMNPYRAMNYIIKF